MICFKNAALFALILGVVLVGDYACGATDNKPYGFFSGLVGGTATSIYDLNAHSDRTPSDIFKKTTGYSKPYMETFGRSGSLPPEKYFSSKKWHRTENELLKTYGNTRQTRDYVRWQKYLYEKQYRIETAARGNFSKVSGEVGEAMMDRFYTKRGWEKIPSKVGNQGIDGLYVKRTANGIVKEVLIAEAKTGQSKPGSTQNGQQTSKKWSDNNLRRRLLQEQKELQSARRLGNRTRVKELESHIKDLNQIRKHVKANNYRAQLYQSKVKPHRTGLTNEIRLSKIHSKGQRGIRLEPQAEKKINIPLKEGGGRLVGSSKHYWSSTEKYLKQVAPDRADKIVAGVKKRIATGKIKSGAEMGRFIQRSLRAEPAIKARAAQRTNPPPSKATLKGVRAHTLNYGSAFAMGGAIGGLSTALMQYSLTGNVELKQVAIGIGVGGGISVATKLAARGTTFALQRLAASRTLQTGIGKALASSALKKAGTYAPFGVGALIVIGTSGYGYLSGQASGSDAAIAAAVGFASIGATVAASSITIALLSGTAAGSVVPVIGNAVGLVVGLGIGVGHACYENTIVRERLLAKQYRLAVAEAEQDKKKSFAERQKMIEQGERMRTNAWCNLKKLCS